MDEITSASGQELTAAQLYALLRLRVTVFVVEQECAYAELDGNDLRATTRHCWVDRDGELAGCLRVLADGDGPVRIGRVCTDSTLRRHGIAARLMGAALDDIGHAETVLGAQTDATGFYARFGFVPEGDVYDEDGIEHIMMRRPPAPST